MPHINHIAVPVDDVYEATAFYRDWFGAEVVPSPRFNVPVSWVVLGTTQVHLVRRPERTSGAYHFAVTISDRQQFEALYWRADREGAFERHTFQHHLYEAVGGVVQLYINDPSGNIVECDYPDVLDLDPEIASLRWRWEDANEQSSWNRQASLLTDLADLDPTTAGEGGVT